MDHFRTWLKENNYDWEDPKLSLGYIKIGQVDLDKTFGKGKSFSEIYNVLSNNLNITNIKIVAKNEVECNYPYSLESDDWKQIQMEGLKSGYKSRGVR